MPRALALSLAGISTAVWLLRPVRIVRVQGFWSSIYWTARSWLWNYPVTPDFASLWDEGDPNLYEKWMEQRNRVLRTWDFLQPFFTSRGYSLYVHSDPTEFNSSLIPQRGRPNLNPVVEAEYPFARSYCKDDKELEFLFVSPVAWPARDKHGQEVVIKAVSGATPTNELKAFQLLHSDELRDDPRNHTIPILEYLEFNYQIFAVMPRQDIASVAWSFAMDSDFVTVTELIRYGHAFFEAVAFLHENKIAHGDILLQNMFMDVIVPCPYFTHFLAGLRGPERRYVFIDFETATLPPEDRSSKSPALEEAFRGDVFRLALELEFNLRCIEDLVPDLGPLFDSMKNFDGPNQPSAAIALSRYEEICRAISSDDLARPVLATRWVNGKLQYREGAPVYPTPTSTESGHSDG